MARAESKAGAAGSRPAAAKASDTRLKPYRERRNFRATPEPEAGAAAGEGGRFVVQKHDARRLHFDLRLELDGVLKSWAVTRGPSLVPGDKRLAVHTEDHPIEYLEFEGVIPAGEYGGGTMIVWDRGRWKPEADPHKGLAKGHLEFTLEGERLKGRWHLVRMKPRAREKTEQWLLIKASDEFAREDGSPEIVEEEVTSVLSGRSNADLAATGEVRADHAARAEERKAAPRRSPAAKPKGARKRILPVFVEPCLATLASRPPTGDAWIHEIKFDGYRLQARVDAGKVKLLTRSGLDWTDRFGAIAKAIAALKIGAALIDGEVVVEDDGGVSSFSALQADLSAGRTDRMVYYAFDLLYLDGSDLADVPLIERKHLLASLLEDAPEGGVVRYSEHIDSDGEAMLRHACRMGLEGIVSKRRDAPYRSGRGGHWLKSKCTMSEEFAVAGYVPSSTEKKAVGSLVLGQYEDGKLIHVGRVGTGFGHEVARQLWSDLEAHRRDVPPFDVKPPAAASKGVRWTEPRLVAEVELRGRTADGLLRHASFKGLREDKSPTEARREAPPQEETGGRSRRGPAAPAASDGPPTTVALTHPDRVFWPDSGITKQGLAEFYTEIADWILPHVVGRPLSLVRCPSGVGEACFFQKHAWRGMGEEINRHRVGDDEVLSIGGLDGLLALVQAGVLEIHPWGSSLADPERPDRIIFDLDPDEGLDFAAVVDAADAVKQRLETVGLVSFLKTTGGKGLHVVAPLRPKASWDETKAFARTIAEAMAKEEPDRFTATVSKRARTGRIYVDYLRNGRGATAVAAYSTRSRPRAPVSTPLSWRELTPSLRPNHFTVENLVARLRHLDADPWADIDAVEQTLPVRRRRKSS